MKKPRILTPLGFSVSVIGAFIAGAVAYLMFVNH